MSALQFGLTPKMKPLSPKRSALVAALDVGTSKIACLIGAPQAASDRRTCCACALIRSTSSASAIRSPAA